MNNTRYRKPLATLLMLLSALLFSLMQVMVKLSASDIGTMQQVFFRNLISMSLSFVLLKKQKLPLLGAKADQPALFGRSLAGFLGVVMLFYASAYAKVADVTLLNRTSPAWVTLFAVLLLKEKLSQVQIPVILLCLAGSFVAMKPALQSDALPMVLALLTAVSSGLAYTLIAYCRGRVNPLTVIFHFSAFSTVASALLMLPSYVNPTPAEWCMLCVVALCGSLGQIGLTYAYQLSPAAEISIYDYFGVVFSAILAYAILGEHITVSTVAGGLMIVGSALWAYWDRKKSA